MNDVTIEGDLASSGTLGNARWADPDDLFNRFAYEDGDIWLGRNPHNGDQAIGYKDDRHIMLCAGNRSGKGRSFIINNLALWQGSTVTYDPKGELPVILAARRGKGDKYCDGLGQDVYVLDPLKHSEVDSHYLAYFNPLAGLDPTDGEFPTWAKRIANALVKVPTGTEGEQWAKRAGRFIATIIMHVMTNPDIPENERTLRTVRKLVLEGEVDLAEKMAERAREKNTEAKSQGKEGNLKEAYDPLEVLVLEMVENKACRGVISEEARNILRMVKESSKYFESVRSEAADQLDWLKSEGMEQNLTGVEYFDESGDAVYLPQDRSLDPSRLKSDPKGISVFVVLPVEDLQTYEPWLQVVFLGLFAAMRQTKGRAKSGHQVLAVFDEFSSLGYQEYIINSLDNIAGSGMKMMIVVQNFGSLKERYKDRMESFFTNAGLEIYFGKIGQVATDYLVKELGHTEVVKVARSLNRGENQSSSESSSIATGTSSSEGGTDSISFGESTGQSWNWSTNVNLSDSHNWGESDGKNMGRNYGPHVFFGQPSLNTGSSLTRNRGRSHTKSRSKTKGGGKSKTQSKNTTIGSSWNTSTSHTETTSHSSTSGYSIGGGIAETFHRKPLLEPNEIAEYLRPLPESDRDYQAYPGFMLVRIQGENPTFLRRSNYDQDPVLENCFSPDPNYDFISFGEQDLLGYQYTDEHIANLILPKALIGDSRLKVNIMPRVSQRFEAADPVLEITHLNGSKAQYDLEVSGRVISIASEQEQRENGDILKVRMSLPLGSEEMSELLYYILEDDLAKIAAEDENERLERQRQEREAEARAEEQAKREAENAEKNRRQNNKRLLFGSGVVAIAATILFTLYNIQEQQRLERERLRQAEIERQVAIKRQQQLAKESILSQFAPAKNWQGEIGEHYSVINEILYEGTTPKFPGESRNNLLAEFQAIRAFEETYGDSTYCLYIYSEEARQWDDINQIPFFSISGGYFKQSIIGANEWCETAKNAVRYQKHLATWYKIGIEVRQKGLKYLPAKHWKKLRFNELGLYDWVIYNKVSALRHRNKKDVEKEWIAISKFEDDSGRSFCSWAENKPDYRASFKYNAKTKWGIWCYNAEVAAWEASTYAAGNQ